MRLTEALLTESWSANEERIIADIQRAESVPRAEAMHLVNAREVLKDTHTNLCQAQLPQPIAYLAVRFVNRNFDFEPKFL